MFDQGSPSSFDESVRLALLPVMGQLLAALCSPMTASNCHADSFCVSSMLLLLLLLLLLFALADNNSVQASWRCCP
jgi:hypothetical protein